MKNLKFRKLPAQEAAGPRIFRSSSIEINHGGTDLASGGVIFVPIPINAIEVFLQMYDVLRSDRDKDKAVGEWLANLNTILFFRLKLHFILWAVSISFFIRQASSIPERTKVNPSVQVLRLQS